MPPHAPPPPEVLRGLVDAAPDALVVVDIATAEIRLANAQAEAMLGHSHDELVGTAVRLLVPEWPGLAEGSLLEATRAGVQAPPTRCRGETWVRHRDGRELPVEVWISVLPCEEGRLVGLALRDVADRLTTHEASERMRDELIATVSHELRTPLTSILGYTEMLVEMGEERLGEHASRLLEAVRRNARRELKLVEDLLTLASLGSSSLHLDAAPTDLAEVARSVLVELGDLADEAGIDLRTSGLEPLVVLGDRDRLTQVLGNLVTNAIKFTPPGGRVDVRLLADGGDGLLEIEDQGMGVPPEELARVFDRLYRAPDVVAAHFPGAGLGLPIAKGIVDAHAGQIAVESQHGLGTTVRVRLPRADVDDRPQNSLSSGLSSPRSAS